MPDTDPVAVAVAARLDDCRPLAEAQDDVADLLAAVEAVLALHPDEFCNCRDEYPCRTYRAISAALLGKEGTNGT